MSILRIHFEVEFEGGGFIDKKPIFDSTLENIVEETSDLKVENIDTINRVPWEDNSYKVCFKLSDCDNDKANSIVSELSSKLNNSKEIESVWVPKIDLED